RPHGLVQETVRAGLLVASGKIAVGLVSSQVLSLSQGVLHAMFLNKVKIAALSLLCVVGLLGAGAGVLSRPAQAQKLEERLPQTTILQPLVKLADPSDKPVVEKKGARP